MTSTAREKSAGAYRTISEVADVLKLPQHVLRFWETRFTQIKPMKRGGGRRYYTPEDVELLAAIRHLLYGEGYTIKGVQRLLRERGPRAVAMTGRGQREYDRTAIEAVGAASTWTETTQVDADQVADAHSDEEAEVEIATAAVPERARSADLGTAVFPVPLRFTRAPEGQRALPPSPVGQLRALLADLSDCRRILDSARI